MTRGWRQGFNTYVDQRTLISDTEPSFVKLQNEMLMMMKQHESFANDLADLYDLSENYTAHRREMFEDD